jgi:hypothetical protein
MSSGDAGDAPSEPPSPVGKGDAPSEPPKLEDPPDPPSSVDAGDPHTPVDAGDDPSWSPGDDAGVAPCAYDRNLGTGEKCSPRHLMPFDSRNERSNALVDVASNIHHLLIHSRHGTGSHSTEETRLQGSKYIV